MSTFFFLFPLKKAQAETSGRPFGTHFCFRALVEIQTERSFGFNLTALFHLNSKIYLYPHFSILYFCPSLSLSLSLSLSFATPLSLIALPGYQTVYSQLLFADKPTSDPFPEVPDVKVFFATTLYRLIAQQPQVSNIASICGVLLHVQSSSIRLEDCVCVPKTYCKIRTSMCVYVCVCVCVCQNERRVPDEWQHDKRQSQPTMNRKYQNGKRPVSSVESLSPWQEKKRELIYLIYTYHSLPVSGPESRQK